MADHQNPNQARYDSILRAANVATKKGAPPVEQWDPPFCGDLDMRIAWDGTWFYLGTPIGRPALVNLFASVLWREADGAYVLVTPVEKVGISVEDVPFIGVTLDHIDHEGQSALVLRTNVGDAVVISADNPLRFVVDAENDGLTPYVLVRGQLEARLARPLLYQLADLGEEREHQGARWFGVTSCGRFFPMMQSEDLARAIGADG